MSAPRPGIERFTHLCCKQLLFQTTARCLTCEEIADNPDTVARIRGLYEILDRGTTPTTVLMPWLPSGAMIRKWTATLQIYNIFTKAVDARQKSGIVRDDTLQMLLDSSNGGWEGRMVILGVRDLSQVHAVLSLILIWLVLDGSHSCRGSIDGICR